MSRAWAEGDFTSAVRRALPDDLVPNDGVPVQQERHIHDQLVEYGRPGNR
ncbi:hypothetical protein [Streptomyces sp. AC154]